MDWTVFVVAMVAAFLGLRLYSVLGDHSVQDTEQLQKRTEERTEPGMVPPRSDDMPRPAAIDALRGAALVYAPEAAPGIRALLEKDRDFDVGRFLDGAKAAYRMILEAFWSGDRETLRDLCDDDTYDAFEAAIADREARGETLDNRLIAIERAYIANASFDGTRARLTVQFDADISAVTRNADGHVIAGSMSDAVQTHDLWTFSRDVRAGDRNWNLDETDEA